MTKEERPFQWFRDDIGDVGFARKKRDRDRFIIDALTYIVTADVDVLDVVVGCVVARETDGPPVVGHQRRGSVTVYSRTTRVKA